MVETIRTPVLIIGAGPAGYTAAIYAARANLQPVIVAGMQPGGQLTITTDVENYPGFAAAVQGPWLMEQMEEQAKHVGARIEHDVITAVDFKSSPFRARGDSGVLYEANSVIVATGAQAKWLGVRGEKEFRARGVSACATCDGFFFRDKHVAVIGGGNTAVEEALYLANICSKVTLVHRRNALRAEQVLQQRLFSHPRIEVIWDSFVEEICGGPADNDGVNEIVLRSQLGLVTRHAVDGVFVAIGHSPETSVFKGHLNLDADGYIAVEPGTTRTSVDGVFAAGDVADKTYRQAVTAAAMGCMAALDAERWLAKR